ncbi:hypothetical protein [Streptomyces sp. NPDC004270]
MGNIEQSGSPTKKFLTELAANLTAILTISGLILFVLLSMLYEKYFAPFGVAPSDVGIGYVETLTRSYGYIALLAVGSIVVFAFFWGSGRLTQRRAARRRRAGRPENRIMGWYRRSNKFLSRHTVAVTLAYVTIYGLFIGYNLLSAYIQADVSRLMVSGRTIPPYRWCNLTLLDVTAQDATLGPGTDALLAKAYNGHTLRYLGSADRIYVLYDVTDRRTVRFSAEKVNLLTAPADEKASC